MKRQLYNLFLIVSAFLFASPVYAQQADWSGCTDEGAATLQCLEVVFQNVVQAAIALVAVILFIMLVIGGFMFLVSSGDPKKMDGARKTITVAITGFIIIILSYLILRVIEAFTGVPVTEFTIPRS